mmetsp:Transcript_30111/g.48254  ORF Transcript_30111/g.48254 Transcript_30111/m.48254 type:complete len:235 (-) Transcript_30111:1412-2116(-)
MQSAQWTIWRRIQKKALPLKTPRRTKIPRTAKRWQTGPSGNGRGLMGAISGELLERVLARVKALVEGIPRKKRRTRSDKLWLNAQKTRLRSASGFTTIGAISARWAATLCFATGAPVATILSVSEEPRCPQDTSPAPNTRAPVAPEKPLTPAAFSSGVWCAHAHTAKITCLLSITRGVSTCRTAAKSSRNWATGNPLQRTISCAATVVISTIRRSRIILRVIRRRIDRMEKSMF